ncbi:MAG: class I SAM-dependent methyltransferase [Rubrivivax sp.]|nr:class I SAM-dependent methyltransferase [Rubrivivax sp.]
MNLPRSAVLPASPRQRLPWPLPALLVWAGGWLLWALLGAAGAAPAWAFGLALAAATAAALACRGRWRQGIAAAGYPLSALALGLAGALPSWVWLLLLLPVLALYPLRAWRDAPLFPTPHAALAGLDTVVGQPRCVHDAGCGLGHGLAALHRLWPQARLSGVEWSPLLALATRWRCRPAQVQRGDMWAVPWGGYDLVYLFQRPESMARAFAKAARELAPGAWLVSLEFAVPGVAPVACLQGDGRKPVWVYQPAGPAAAPCTAASTTAQRGR